MGAPGWPEVTPQEAKMLRDALRLLKRNDFQGGAFHCISCGELPAHPYRDGQDGHAKGCKWDNLLTRLKTWKAAK